MTQPKEAINRQNLHKKSWMNEMGFLIKGITIAQESFAAT